MVSVDVSVLMSVYIKERSEYFRKSLKSVFNQTTSVKEIVLVLDGPITPDLQAVIDDYQRINHSIIKLVPLSENVGLGKALAVGVEACSYGLIARMDTDDIMLPTRIEKQYAEFKENPGLTIVGSNIDEFYDTPSEIVGRRIVPESYEEICNFSKKRNPFNHMTVMFKKSAILDVGNYQPMMGFEDYYLWVRLLKAGYKGKNIQESLVHARTGEGMYARRGGKKYFVNGLKGRKAIYKAGLGSFFDYLISCSAHIVVSLLPNSLRGKLYEKKLRN
ncbi:MULTISPECIES: glycosyltransferase [Enterococcus]|uniref:Glycosyltransferase n=1 Tax=Candidatus Enterococcus murrayae TaxID=2815321 RepID=A0ABS3HP00_9ENTE|nr:glycosyltransferase [Enterococcus sp. MJM16]MBO0454293.1 glycosyltransferase [Enterococcus sp. MJM16]